MTTGSPTVQRSAHGPQEVRPRPILADDAQRPREHVSAGQTVFSARNQWVPTTADNPPFSFRLDVSAVLPDSAVLSSLATVGRCLRAGSVDE